MSDNTVQKLMGAMRKAIEDYHMIENGDRIAVGVSGGKDSVSTLIGLAKLRRYIGIDYEIVAVCLDPQFGGIPNDFTEIEKLCESLDVKLDLRRTEIGKIIFEDRQETNPCSLCARMRRGLLHDIAKENGCNKMALGHNFDDAAETFLMNLCNEGRIGCFSPVTWLSRKEITVIRPIIYCREADIVRIANHEHFPIVKSACPADKHTEREHAKLLLEKLEHEEGYDGLCTKIIGAMQRGGISGWGK
jgi:tRNA 2-thiocytidine biosynthesis protein TtcA